MSGVEQAQPKANNDGDVASLSKRQDREDSNNDDSFLRKAMEFPSGWISCSKTCCKAIPNTRSSWQKANRKVPQHAPLYAALFCSIVAVILSIHTHLSTKFVTLEEPLRISPFFKNVNIVGLSKWQLCVIKQDALDTIIEEGEDGIELTSKLPISTTTTTTDIQRNVTSRVVTTYHYNTPHSLQQSNWMNEPDHDDILASGDYPYNDDDAFESELPMDYWSCHLLQITSKSARDDKVWNIARAFFMMGSIMGIISTMLLVSLILVRGRDAKRRWKRGIDVRRELRHNKRLQRQLSGSDEPLVQQHQHQPESTVSRHHQTLLEANNLLSLDTDSSGYRPISICFLISYLLQSLTLLFLDSDLCRNQVCSMSTGAHGLLAACLLWVVSGLLTLFMMKKVRTNERRVRRFKRRISREESNVQNFLANDNGNDVEEGAKSLLPVTSSSSKDEDGQILDEDSAMNTTADTESSGSSSSAAR